MNDEGGGSLGRLPRVMFQLDPRISPGEVHVGGTLVMDNPSDEDLGWAVQAKLVRAGDEETLGAAIFQATQGGALELKRLPDIEPEPF